jgi:hypothetical protein
VAVGLLDKPQQWGGECFMKVNGETSLAFPRGLQPQMRFKYPATRRPPLVHRGATSALEARPQIWARQLSRSILPHQPEDGDRFSLRNVVVFCKTFTYQTMERVQKSQIILYLIPC